MYTVIAVQWCSYTGAHLGTGPTISLCGPTIKILHYHVIRLIIVASQANSTSIPMRGWIKESYWVITKVSPSDKQKGGTDHDSITFDLK